MHFAKQVYSGRMTQGRLEEFTRFVREALRQHVNDQVRNRLQSAMLPDSEEEPAPEEEAAHESDDTPPDGPSRFQCFQTGSRQKRMRSCYTVFMALHDYIVTLAWR